MVGGVGAEALAIICGKALDDAGFEEVKAGFRYAANFVGKGAELVGRPGREDVWIR